MKRTVLLMALTILVPHHASATFSWQAWFCRWLGGNQEKPRLEDIITKVSQPEVKISTREAVKFISELDTGSFLWTLMDINPHEGTEGLAGRTSYHYVRQGDVPYLAERSVLKQLYDIRNLPVKKYREAIERLSDKDLWKNRYLLVTNEVWRLQRRIADQPTFESYLKDLTVRNSAIQVKTKRYNTKLQQNEEVTLEMVPIWEHGSIVPLTDGLEVFTPVPEIRVNGILGNRYMAVPEGRFEEGAKLTYEGKGRTGLQYPDSPEHKIVRLVLNKDGKDVYIQGRYLGAFAFDERRGMPLNDIRQPVQMHFLMVEPGNTGGVPGVVMVPQQDNMGIFQFRRIERR